MAAFLAPTALRRGMNITLLKSDCDHCLLWKRVTAGVIGALTSADGVTTVTIAGKDYELTEDGPYKVARTSEAPQWLALAKSIICNCKSKGRRR